EIELVNLTNRFAADTTLSVESVDIWTNTSMTIDPDTSLTLESGESETLTGEVTNCDPGTANEVEVTVELDGGGVWAKIFGDYYTREFTVTCEEPSVEGVWFNGAGTVNIDTTGLDEVDIHYWTTEDNPGANSGNSGSNSGDGSGPINVTKTGTNVTVDTNSNVQLEQGQKTVVAVEIEGGFDVIYAHPGYNTNTGDIDNWGKGDGNVVDEFPTVE
ncbi:MAG: hypothetical protein KGY43_03890, partial [Halodesulfurarchaeum sp.]|nr:hypothetical protein [Halodesulfurarchaeum sp.]